MVPVERGDPSTFSTEDATGPIFFSVMPSCKDDLWKVCSPLFRTHRQIDRHTNIVLSTLIEWSIGFPSYECPLSGSRDMEYSFRDASAIPRGEEKQL